MLFPVAGPGRPDAMEQHQAAAPADAVARGAAAVSMGELLASCAAARAVSVPPAPAPAPAPAAHDGRRTREAA
ncbi:hypothetical protein [Streptomyces fragilis]|uniref:Uncharacterized protein n=1 Tax=Streptomyces fragilis TaxID=67301 RepID=A0ABV2YJV5_9ACTN|nr:hypothetical protein [Streptomyces fragilis]